MSVVDTPKSPLVVPKQVTHAFHGEILPKKSAILEIGKPENALGKLTFYAKKSLLLTGPTFSFGGAFLLADISSQALQSGSAPLTAATFLGTTAMLMSGILSFGMGLGSLLRGDNEFSPLSPSKSYLILQEKQKENIIVPFSDWDNVFSKHDNCNKPEQLLPRKIN